MSSKENLRKLLVTNALPYANGPLHLGHLLEHIQTDMWVRFQRLKGHECLYVAGDDAHGTPIMLKAEELEISPEALIKKVYKEHLKDLNAFLISYDNYYTTHSPENKILSEQIFNLADQKGLIEKKEIKQLFDTKKEMFLSDRYVKGDCPNCNALNQYGDNCEICSSTYSAIELANPISQLSNSIPELRNSEHLFFNLKKLKQEIQEWLLSSDIQEPVINKMQEWLSADLRDWDISRDIPYFGFEIPSHPNKFFYVWLDAPIGYIASTQNYLSTTNSHQTLLDIWGIKSEYEIFHFIGKDVMYFHTLFWPALLDAGNFKKPEGVYVHGFLTINGEKMSKSRGTFILAKDYVKYLNPEYLRYFFSTKLGDGIEDIDMNLDDFKQRVNSDLVGKYINIASRSAKFINNNFSNTLSDELDKPELIDEFIDSQELISNLFEKRLFSKAVREIMTLADKANQYFDSKQPWVIAKQDAKSKEVQKICTTTLNLFKILSIYLHPVIPNITNDAFKFLNLKKQSWNEISSLLTSSKINKYEALIYRIEGKDLDSIQNESKV